MEVNLVGGEKTMITVESGAKENDCPWDWGETLFGTKDQESWMSFRNSSGGQVGSGTKGSKSVLSFF